MGEEKYMTIEANYKEGSVSLRVTRNTNDEIIDNKTLFKTIYQSLSPLDTELSKEFGKSLELKLTVRG